MRELIKKDVEFCEISNYIENGKILWNGTIYEFESYYIDYGSSSYVMINYTGRDEDGEPLHEVVGEIHGENSDYFDLYECDDWVEVVESPWEE